MNNPLRGLSKFFSPWLLGLILGLVVLAATQIFVVVVPKSYTASAVVAVVPNPGTSPSGELVRLAVPTYASLATSTSLADTMARTHDESRHKMESAIDARVAPSTNTVIVSVSWSNPERAAELANGVVAELITFSERDPILNAFSVAPAVPPHIESFPPRRATLVVGALLGILIAIAVPWRNAFTSAAATRVRSRHDASDSRADPGVTA